MTVPASLYDLLPHKPPHYGVKCSEPGCRYGVRTGLRELNAWSRADKHAHKFKGHPVTVLYEGAFYGKVVRAVTATDPDELPF